MKENEDCLEGRSLTDPRYLYLSCLIIFNYRQANTSFINPFQSILVILWGKTNIDTKKCIK